MNPVIPASIKKHKKKKETHTSQIKMFNLPQQGQKVLMGSS